MEKPSVGFGGGAVKSIRKNGVRVGVLRPINYIYGARIMPSVKRHNICGTVGAIVATPAEKPNKPLYPSNNIQLCNTNYINYIINMLGEPKPSFEHVKKHLSFNVDGIVNEVAKKLIHLVDRDVVVDYTNKYCSVCERVLPVADFNNKTHDKLLELARLPDMIFSCCNECEPDLHKPHYSNSSNRLLKSWRAFINKNAITVIYTKFLLTNKRRYDLNELTIAIYRAKKYRKMVRYMLIRRMVGRDIAYYILKF